LRIELDRSCLAQLAERDTVDAARTRIWGSGVTPVRGAKVDARNRCNEDSDDEFRATMIALVAFFSRGVVPGRYAARVDGVGTSAGCLGRVEVA